MAREDSDTLGSFMEDEEPGRTFLPNLHAELPSPCTLAGPLYLQRGWNPSS